MTDHCLSYKLPCSHELKMLSAADVINNRLTAQIIKVLILIFKWSVQLIHFSVELHQNFAEFQSNNDKKFQGIKIKDKCFKNVTN